MNALKQAARKALMKEESAVTHVSDGGSDDVILVQSTKKSTEASARESARSALQHVEHAYMEMTKLIQDRSKEKGGKDWLDTMQDRLDMVL